MGDGIKERAAEAFGFGNQFGLDFGFAMVRSRVVNWPMVTATTK